MIIFRIILITEINSYRTQNRHFSGAITVTDGKDFEPARARLCDIAHSIRDVALQNVWRVL